MKRVLCTMTVVMAFASIASAQDSSYWFDIRNGTGAANTIQNILAPRSPFTNGQEFAPPSLAFNAGVRGDGQKLWMEPQITSTGAGSYTNVLVPNGYPNFDGDGNRATGDAYLYSDVFDDVSGTQDVLASLGVNLTLAQPAGTAANSNRIDTNGISFSLANDGTLGAGAPNPPWNGANNGTIVGGDPPSWVNAKAVRVPVTTGPAYNAAMGIQVGGPYRVGKLRVTAAIRNCTGLTAGQNTRSRINAKLSVNNLLITRVYNGVGDTQENVSFGYNGASLDPAVNGNTDGANSATDDLVIEIRRKGDFSGDGLVNASDLGGFNAARAASLTNTAKQSQMFLGDFTGDFLINATDLGTFNAARARTLGVCP